MQIKFKFPTLDSTYLKEFFLVFVCLFALNIVSDPGKSINLDGTLTQEEWSQAREFDLEFELMPSRNTPAALKTTAYVKFDKKNLYVGIKAFGNPDNTEDLNDGKKFCLRYCKICPWKT